MVIGVGLVTQQDSALLSLVSQERVKSRTYGIS